LLAHLNFTVQGGPNKSKPLSSYQKVVLNRIKICQWISLADFNTI